jgi:hypothetical protein
MQIICFLLSYFFLNSTLLVIISSVIVIFLLSDRLLSNGRLHFSGKIIFERDLVRWTKRIKDMNMTYFKLRKIEF